MLNKTVLVFNTSDTRKKTNFQILSEYKETQLKIKLTFLFI